MNTIISYEEISSEVKSAIADIVGMEQDEVLEDMSLMCDLGIDSLDLVDLLSDLGKKFNVEMSIGYWTEKIHAEALKIGQVGAKGTLASISELTGLIFSENDVNSLEEILNGSYQTWDVVRNILGYIKVKSLSCYIETKIAGVL
jgi:acyl carrier protein